MTTIRQSIAVTVFWAATLTWIALLLMSVAWPDSNLGWWTLFSIPLVLAINTICICLIEDDPNTTQE